MKNDYCVVFVTAKNKQEAEKIARGLLQARLAACVNIMEGVKSLFMWEGKLDTAQEVLLVIKTQQKLFSSLAKKVKALHSYKVPEIIALPIIAGDKAYLQWVKENTQHHTS